MTERESPYLWSTTALTNGSADPNINFAENQLPSTVNNSARAMMAGFARFLKDTNGSLTTGGSANAYTLTINGTQTAYATGHIVAFKANFTNTGAATLNVTNADASALGAKALRKLGDIALIAGEIQANGHYVCQYDAAANGAAGAWMVFNIGSALVKITPGGRLTLNTGTPVMVSSYSAQTTIYYTPYFHDQIMLYDGSGWVNTTFTELSQATTDTTKSPAAVAANKNYDLFVWNDSGTIRCTRGPAWSSDTSRGTGAGTTELVRTNGVWLNANSITNGPAASRGTYVGSVRSNGSSQIDFTHGAAGTAALLGVWNMYNRVLAAEALNDNSAATWTYTSATVRPSNNSTTNRISFISGIAEDGVFTTFTQDFSTAAAANGFATIGIALDSTTVMDTICITLNTTNTAVARTTPSAINSYGPQTGWHFIQALEGGDGTNVTTYSGGTHHKLTAVLRL